MKTNERPTPITDAHFANQGFRNVYTADVDFAKLLERQLAESREENARINKSLNNASAIYDAACEQRDRLAKWIVNNPPKYGGDHACAECYPHSHCLINGFQCGYHTALAAVKGGKQ